MFKLNETDEKELSKNILKVLDQYLGTKQEGFITKIIAKAFTKKRDKYKKLIQEEIEKNQDILEKYIKEEINLQISNILNEKIHRLMPSSTEMVSIIATQVKWKTDNGEKKALEKWIKEIIKENVCITTQLKD